MKYDFGLFQTFIPKSCLVEELILKFIEVPKLWFDEDGKEIKSYLRNLSTEE